MEIFRHKCLNRSSGAINNASKIEQLYEKLHNTGSFIPSQMDGVIIQIGSHLINLRALLKSHEKKPFYKKFKSITLRCNVTMNLQSTFWLILVTCLGVWSVRTALNWIRGVLLADCINWMWWISSVIFSRFKLIECKNWTFGYFYIASAVIIYKLLKWNIEVCQFESRSECVGFVSMNAPSIHISFLCFDILEYKKH